LGITPGTPADHCYDTKNYGQRVTLWYEHVIKDKSYKIKNISKKDEPFLLKFPDFT
jgi:hypothetical protein